MGNLSCCCYQVDESTVNIKERFGKFQEVLQPGCYFLPCVLGYRLAGNLSLRLQQLDVKCHTMTKDHEFVDVVASVHYRALPNRAYDAFYMLSNPKVQIEGYVRHVIGASVAKLKLKEAFERQNEIAKAVEDKLVQAMSDYGYEIVQFPIIDIKPHEHVMRAINEINAAIEKAEIKRAEGMAEFMHVADGVRQSVLGFLESVPGASAKDAMDAVLMAKYLDTMKEICASSKSDVVFIPPGAGAEVRIHICEGLHQA